MTCNLAARPHDPLPLYTARARDLETSSVRSAAPSYTSAAPSYHSSAPSVPSLPVNRNSTINQPQDRPRPQDFAPGFRPPPTSLRTVPGRLPDTSAYAIRSWSSIASSPQERLYHSVAKRRATMANVESERLAMVSASSMLLARAQPPAECAEDIIEEDPFLVGSEAAEQARKERLKRKRARGEEVLRQEDKAWDFMLGQMADWDERERSWARFKRESEKPGLLRRRLGIFGRK
ncbi:MAG: hypothetical protein M1825_005677 [Sarcosagium campestre]|nr:MAG: hypothetical protein M1825_005677 [Sarcosagium campestre]